MKKILMIVMVLVCLFIFSSTVNAESTYSIKSGDTLSRIAKTFYGDASKYGIIFEANKDIIKNPNLIQPGWKIVIPDSESIKIQQTPIARSREPSKIHKETFKTTAYDLSITSCGKAQTHPAYGITASGKSIVGKSHKEAMSCAVDPKVIPLGSFIFVTFENESYKKYDGVYQALDVGGGVKGKHIDIFLGDFKSNKENKEVIDFGCVKSTVVILTKGW